mmetsp:Transcript_30422/g.49512  ORF Transcript_30422/g.49512 Transcript_30422/m.49512 type:complete len:514 (-) Transcript_30422:87-1628(-)
MNERLRCFLNGSQTGRFVRSPSTSFTDFKANVVEKFKIPLADTTRIHLTYKDNESTMALSDSEDMEDMASLPDKVSTIFVTTSTCGASDDTSTTTTASNAAAASTVSTSTEPTNSVSYKFLDNKEYGKRHQKSRYKISTDTKFCTLCSTTKESFVRSSGTKPMNWHWVNRVHMQKDAVHRMVHAYLSDPRNDPAECDFDNHIPHVETTVALGDPKALAKQKRQDELKRKHEAASALLNQCAADDLMAIQCPQNPNGEVQCAETATGPVNGDNDYDHELVDLDDKDDDADAEADAATDANVNADANANVNAVADYDNSSPLYISDASADKHDSPQKKNTHMYPNLGFSQNYKVSDKHVAMFPPSFSYATTKEIMPPSEFTLEQTQAILRAQNEQRKKRGLSLHEMPVPTSQLPGKPPLKRQKSSAKTQPKNKKKPKPNSNGQRRSERLKNINKKSSDKYCLESCCYEGCDKYKMIGCDNCDEWYHWKCLNLNEADIAKIGKAKWYCHDCTHCRD